MAQQGMGSAQEILARCLGDLGDDNDGETYIDMVRRVGLMNVETEADNLSDSQLHSLHVLINDDVIYEHVKAIHERYPEVKELFDLSAMPWYD